MYFHLKLLEFLVIVASVTVPIQGRARHACEVCECHNRRVDCSGRGLVELPYGIPNDTKLLELQDNLLRDIPYDGFMKFELLMVLDLSNNSITTSFEMPASVLKIYASRNMIQDIRPMMRNGVNLMSVDFAFNSLEKIETETFIMCKQLIEMMLDHNNISKVEPRGFVGPEDMNSLKIQNNPLTELGPDNTEGLQCINLRISNTDLKTLRPRTFSRISKLTFLKIQRCQLEVIPTELLFDPAVEYSPAREMDTVDLSINNIRSVEAGAFIGVKTFRILDMHQNNLTSLPSGLFGNSTKVITLSLSNNRLVSSGLPEDLLDNVTISSMDISSNLLSTIPKGLFRFQNMMTYLYLQNNLISVLDKNSFRGLQSLQELMIFNNPITEVVDWLFYETKITKLYMFQTNITSVGERAFATMNRTLNHVSLYDSHLRNVSNLAWQDLGKNCYVALDNKLDFAPAMNRTDLKIELVGDGFAQPIIVPRDVARILNQSGFGCSKETKGKPWSCAPCPQGSYGRKWSEGCLDCPSGGFYQIKTGQATNDPGGMNCQKCNMGTYVTPAAHPGKSTADCVVCPTGTNKSLHAGFRACPCLDNYYRKDRFGECHPCPTEGLNCSGEYQHLLPGFWWTWDWPSSDAYYQSYWLFVQNVRVTNDSYDSSTSRFLGKSPKVHKCPRSESCVNSGEGINVTCDYHYTGWLCSQCRLGFYKWFDQCLECPQLWLFLLEVIALLTAIVLLFILIAWNIRKRRTYGRSIVSVLLARGKILLGFYQVMGEIYSALREIPWPEVMVSVGAVFKMLEVNIMRFVISPRCYFPNFTYQNIYIQFLAGSSFVVFVVTMACCIYGFTKYFLLYKKTPVAKLNDVLSQTKQMCYLVVVMLLFVSYPSLSSDILTLLPSGCESFSLDEEETVSVTRLRSDYSINCQKQQHLNFNHAAEAALIYVVGFPSVLLLLLWRKHSRRRKNDILNPLDYGRRDSASVTEHGIDELTLHAVARESSCLNAGRVGYSILPTTEEDDDTLNRTESEPSEITTTSRRAEISWESFLCDNYKPQFWYWEIVELARKILQTLFVLLFGPEDHTTMFATIVLSVGFLVMHAYLKPMKDAAEHRLQMCSLGTIFLNLLAASLVLLPTDSGHGSQERKEVLSVILVLLNLSIIAFVAGSLLWTGVKALWRCRCCHRTAACIHCLCCCYFQRRYDYISDDYIGNVQDSPSTPTISESI